jgi:hypothetical protein
MKTWVGSIAVLMVSGVISVTAQESQRRALAEELLTVMKMQDAIEKSFDVAKQMIPAQMEKMAQEAGDTAAPADMQGLTGRMMDMIAEEFSWNKLKADYIALYAETFTEQELKDMVAFYKSPAGQAYINKQPELMKRSMELTQKLMMKIMPKIRAMTEDVRKKAPAPEKQK